MKRQEKILNRWINRFWSIASGVSVRTKILGIALALVLLLGAMAILVVRVSLRNVVTQELELSAVSISENLADSSTDAILVNNQFLLYQLISETKGNYADIRYIFVVDSKGSVLVHTFGNGFPTDLITANAVPAGEESQIRVLETTEGLIWDVAAPIYKGRVGTIRMGFSDALFLRTVNVVTTQLLLATLFVSTIGILLAIFLTRILTRPIQQLAWAAHAVGQGDLNQKVTRWTDDEIGELTDSFNTMVENLRLAAEANRERDLLRTELVERVITAQEEERKRIAYDLHDQTSQALVSLIVQLKLVEAAKNADARRNNLEAFRIQLRATLDEVRKMALELHPKVLDDLGLEQAIHWFAESCSKNHDLQITVIIKGDLSNLPERFTVTIYRVIQESLSNVVKHSQARHAQVEVDHQPGELLLRINDDGKGFIVNAASEYGGNMGILGMQERVSLLGGHFEIHSQPGKGTTVQAEIPITVAHVPDGQKYLKEKVA